MAEKAPDYAKAAGIALVVFGHALRGLISSGILDPTPFWDAVDRSIYLFHMPLFFYLSGLFFERQARGASYKNYIGKIAFLLLVPLAVWSYLQFGLQYLAGANANNAVSLNEVLTAPFPPEQQFWFLATLFTVMAISAVLIRAPLYRLALFLVLAACLAFRVFAAESLSYLTTENGWTNVLGQTIIHYPYFLLGIFWGTGTLRKIPGPLLLWVAIFISAQAAYNLGGLNGPFWTFALASACILSLYKGLLDCQDRGGKEYAFSKAMIFIGMNSMIIYLAHVIATGAMRAILLKAGITSFGAHLALDTAAGIMLPLMLVPVGIMAQKFVPVLSKAVLPVRIKR